MVFNSFLFFGFFAATGILFDSIKQKWRWIFLLIASIVFIACSSPKGLFFLTASCIVTYLCTLLIDKLYQTDLEDENKKEKSRIKAKILIVLDIAVNLGILFATKYLNFFGSIFALATGKPLNMIVIIVPLGISFYTFMILGYAIDVYRGEYRPQRNFAKILLFASFFPQLINGPISRYVDIQEKLYNPPDIEYQRCRDALMLFAWGLFKKLCIADNISIYVNMIYGNYQKYHGIVTFSGAVAYAIYIYADFSGCIDMARGVSKYFGIELKNNFNHPYFAESVDEFWRRWHITLSSWFKDYLFYPILRSSVMTSMSRGLRQRGNKKLSKILPTSIALFIVWLFTGLWHGSRGTYILWGLYYSVIIIFSNAISILYKKKKSKFTVLPIIFTFLIVCFGYIFFNASNISDAFGMIRSILSLPIISINSIMNLGLQYYKKVGGAVYFTITIISLVLFVIIDFLTYKGKDIYHWICSKNRMIKYISSMIIIFFLLLMMNRTSGDFTYMQF